MYPDVNRLQIVTDRDSLEMLTGGDWFQSGRWQNQEA